MEQEYIEIKGARENNLKNISLRIPKRKITIFTGVSGSGKSSIVFDTIATEAQRQLNENFSMFVRNFLPSYSPPHADEIANLSMAVVVDQRRLGGNSHSTLGTITDISPVLRLLYSRIGEPHIGFSNVFSFNDPQGMCPECNGMGKKLGVVADSFLDLTKSLNEGAVQVPVFATWEKNSYVSSGFFDNDKKLADYTPEEMDLLLYGKNLKYKLAIGGGSLNATYLGIIEKFERAYIKRDLKTLSERTQKMVAPYIALGPCQLCKGARLSQAALSCKVAGKNIAEFSAMEISELIHIITGITNPLATPIVNTLKERLQHLIDIGLDYLSLDRETSTLSGGESQRVKMVKHLASSLIDVMYIFDEPSVGLHPRDVHRLNGLLRKLRDKGNTLIVVEHDPDVIKVADHVVDVGPHAGTNGGEIVFEGQFEQSAVGTSTRSNTATYTGVMDDLRKDFAKANQVSASLFSFNSKGACENCQGLGVLYTDLAFLDAVKTPCEICAGKRFNEQVLAYKLDGKSISFVLELTVLESLNHFHQTEIRRKLQAMSDVGLNYLTLGQPLSTLSGGETG
jgi:excinuclease UvrABC ATPase subunit